jgi:hypothetical protein
MLAYTIADRVTAAINATIFDVVRFITIGILRNHKIMRNGRIRDTIYFQSEWPLVKQRLLQKTTYYDNSYACPVIRENA